MSQRYWILFDVEGNPFKVTAHNVITGCQGELIFINARQEPGNTHIISSRYWSSLIEVDENDEPIGWERIEKRKEKKEQDVTEK